MRNKSIEMQVDLIEVNTQIYYYSRWYQDSENWLQLKEYIGHQENTVSEYEMMKIINSRMLCQDKSGFYVRTGGLEKDFRVAMANAKTNLYNLVENNQIRIEPDQPSLISALIATRHDNLHPRSIDADNNELLEELREELENDGIDWEKISRITNKANEKWGDEDELDLDNLFEKLDIPLVRVKKGQPNSTTPSLVNKTSIIRTEDGAFTINSNPITDKVESTRHTGIQMGGMERRPKR
jgi:hypothetical protein